MPSLRQMNMVFFLTLDDLDSIKRSALFTDHRQVDVQFAFIIDDTFQGVDLTQHLPPQANRVHRREIVHARCLVNYLIHESLGPTNLDRDVSNLVFLLVFSSITS